MSASRAESAEPGAARPVWKEGRKAGSPSSVREALLRAPPQRRPDGGAPGRGFSGFPGEQPRQPPPGP